jgi:hypothetical protein
MRIVVKEPGKAPEVREIEHGLDAMQAIVAHGDHRMIELIPDGPPGLDLWANEEAKYARALVNDEWQYLIANLSIFDGQDYVMGTVLVTASTNMGETRGLEDAEVDIAVEWLKQHAVGILDAFRAEAMAELYR